MRMTILSKAFMIRPPSIQFRNRPGQFPFMKSAGDRPQRSSALRLPVAAALLMSIVVSGCTQPQQPVLNSHWVGYAAIADDRLLPIRAILNLDPDSLAGHFLVAGERTDIPEITLQDDSIRFDFSEYGASMLARRSADRLSGRYYRFRDDTTSFPFVLFHDEVVDRGELVDSSVAGTYRVVLGSGENTDDTSIARLRVQNGELSGTVIHPGGDYGLLEGSADNGLVRLYRFTGWQALYFEITESEIGYRGRFQVLAEPPTDVAFIRTTDDAHEASLETKMRNPEESFLFSGVTKDGEIVTSGDERFAGKPLVINIMGTWCHNCLDAAPLLQEAREQYAGDSLEVVSLSFEVRDDVVTGLKNLALFRDRFGLAYPMLYCGSLDESNIEARLRSQLEDFYSYPTTIFVDRDGRVVEIHTGFNGPSTGSRWVDQIAAFQQAVERIVGS